MASHLPRLSSVVLIALAWDEPRRALADRIRAGGVGCTTLLVRDDALAVSGRDPVVVSARAVASGGAISL